MFLTVISALTCSVSAEKYLWNTSVVFVGPSIRLVRLCDWFCDIVLIHWLFLCSLCIPVVLSCVLMYVLCLSLFGLDWFIYIPYICDLCVYLRIYVYITIIWICAHWQFEICMDWIKRINSSLVIYLNKLQIGPVTDYDNIIAK